MPSPSFCCPSNARSLVLSKVRAILGPNLHTIISGGARLSTWRTSIVAWASPSCRATACRNATGPISVETPRFPSGLGRLPLAGQQMMIAPDGGLLVRHLRVEGYHSLPRFWLSVGWFKTGDLAIDDRGHLRITVRKKNISIRAVGVSPGSQLSTPTHREHHRRR